MKFFNKKNTSKGDSKRKSSSSFNNRGSLLTSLSGFKIHDHDTNDEHVIDSLSQRSRSLKRFFPSPKPTVSSFQKIKGEMDFSNNVSDDHENQEDLVLSKTKLLVDSSLRGEHERNLILEKQLQIISEKAAEAYDQIIDLSVSNNELYQQNVQLNHKLREKDEIIDDLNKILLDISNNKNDDKKNNIDNADDSSNRSSHVSNRSASSMSEHSRFSMGKGSYGKNATSNRCNSISTAHTSINLINEFSSSVTTTTCNNDYYNKIVNQLSYRIKNLEDEIDLKDSNINEILNSNTAEKKFNAEKLENFKKIIDQLSNNFDYLYDSKNNIQPKDIANGMRGESEGSYSADGNDTLVNDTNNAIMYSLDKRFFDFREKKLKLIKTTN